MKSIKQKSQPKRINTLKTFVAGVGVSTSSNKKWIHLREAIRVWQSLSSVKDKSPQDLESEVIKSKETREVPDISIPQMTATVPLIRLSFCENNDGTEKIFFYFDDEHVIKEVLGFTMINDCFSSKKVVSEDGEGDLQVGHPIELPVPALPDRNEVKTDQTKLNLPILNSKYSYKGVDIPATSTNPAWIHLAKLISATTGYSESASRHFIDGSDHFTVTPFWGDGLPPNNIPADKITVCEMRQQRNRPTKCIRAIDLPRLAVILDKREAMISADTRVRVLAGDQTLIPEIIANGNKSSLSKPILDSSYSYKGIDIPATDTNPVWIHLIKLLSAITGRTESTSRTFIETSEIFEVVLNSDNGLPPSNIPADKIMVCEMRQQRNRPTKCIRSIDLPRLAAILDKREAMISADTRGRVLAGDQTIKDDVDVAAAIQTTLRETNDDNILGALSGAYNTDEGQSRRVQAAPEVAAIASGVEAATIQQASTVRKIPLSARTVYTKRLGLTAEQITELEDMFMQPGIYVIVCKPKLMTKPDSYPSELPSGCMNLISSAEDSPHGFAKVGMWMKDGHSRLKTVCDFFPESMYDITIKMVHVLPEAAAWEDMVKKTLKKHNLIGENASQSNFILTESGCQKLTEVLVFDDLFGEDELIELCQKKFNKIARMSPKKNIEIEKLKIESDYGFRKFKIDGILKLASIDGGEKFLKAIMDV